MNQNRQTPSVQGQKSQNDEAPFNIKTPATLDLINELINRWCDEQNDVALLASIKVYFQKQRAAFKKFYSTGANASANGRMHVDYICPEGQKDSILLSAVGKADIIEEFQSGYKLLMIVKHLTDEQYDVEVDLVDDDAPASMPNMIKLVQIIEPLVQRLDTNFGLWNDQSEQFIAANLRFGSVHYTKHTIRMLLELEKQLKPEGFWQEKRITNLPDGRPVAQLCNVLRNECGQHNHSDDVMMHADEDTQIFYNIRSFNDVSHYVFSIPHVPPVNVTVHLPNTSPPVTMTVHIPNLL